MAFSAKVRRFAALCAAAGALLCLFDFPAAAASSRAAGAARERVTIGLVDTFTPNFYIETFTPLVEKLRAALPQYDFHVKEFPRGTGFSGAAFEANTFLVLSSGDAVMHPELGLEEIATRRHLGAKSAARSVGALFVVRSDKPYKALSDLKGLKAATTSPLAFEGSLIPKGEIASEGFDPERFFSDVVYSEWNVPDVPILVLSGQVDVGVLETCALEEALASGAVPEGALRPIHVKGRDPCVRSTGLYPDMMIASLPTADADVVRAVTIEVLKMPRDGNGCDWVTNNNRANVTELMRELKVGPYAYLRDYSLSGIWARFQLEISAALIGLALLLVHVVRVNLLVRRRTRELEKAAESREAAAEALRESRQRIGELERAGIATELCALFAHEVKQPITNVVNYLTAACMIKEQAEKSGREVSKENEAREVTALKQSLSEAYRAAEIVDRVRGAAKREKPVRVRTDIREVLEEAVKHSGAAKHPEVTLRVTLPPARTLWVQGDPLELELLVLNLVKNAFEALAPQSSGPLQSSPAEVRLAARSEPGSEQVVIEVCDNGPTLSDAAFARLGASRTSGKAEGLGFGLMIVRAIAESHCGHLTFERLSPCGLAARVVLPLDRTEETQ